MARMRVFAGPNGSGKTTLNASLQGQFNFGVYLNPDDLYRDIAAIGRLDLDRYGLNANALSWADFQQNHSLVTVLRPDEAVVIAQGNTLCFSKSPSVYMVSIVIDYLRHLLLEAERTFSFETVFSHESKVRLMEKASSKGYRTYLYFVCTSSPEINVFRVQQRKQEGGHDVPEEKIRSRYSRSLQNLTAGIRIAYRTYLFDNSGMESSLVGEITPKHELHLFKSSIPVWVEKHVLPIFR